LIKIWQKDFRQQTSHTTAAQSRAQFLTEIKPRLLGNGFDLSAHGNWMQFLGERKKHRGGWKKRHGALSWMPDNRTSWHRQVRRP
jgi:hypothetical protein